MRAFLTTLLFATGSIHAAVTQITITSNYIQTPEYSYEESGRANGSAVFKNELFEDLTGDGISDINILNAAYVVDPNVAGGRNNAIRFDLDGVRQRAYQGEFANAYRVGDNADGGIQEDVANILSGGTWEGVIAVGISDSSINGGATTEAWLVVEAHHINAWGANRIKLTKLVFDDESIVNTVTAVDARDNDYTEFSPIPEPSSTVLLGLAGLGFVVRRKR